MAFSLKLKQLTKNWMTALFTLIAALATLMSVSVWAQTPDTNKKLILTASIAPAYEFNGSTGSYFFVTGSVAGYTGALEPQIEAVRSAADAGFMLQATPSLRPCAEGYLILDMLKATERKIIPADSTVISFICHRELEYNGSLIE